MKSLRDSKITIFGDSIPKGIVCEDGKIKTIEDSVVNIVAKKCKLDITNLSSYGQTLSKIVKRNIIDDYILSLDKVKENIAVISLGGNDSDFDWLKVAQNPLESHNPKTTPKDFRFLLNDTIDKLQSAGVKVVLTNIVPVSSKRYFNNVISKITDGDKVLQFFKGDIDTIYRHQELYNLIILDCARNKNCRVLDIRENFLFDTNYLNYLCSDGIHPNKEGHKIIADSIITQIVEKVEHVI